MSIKAKHPVHVVDSRPESIPSGMGRVLIVQYSAQRDGSAFSALLLANGFLENGWETTVAFGHEGPMEEVFREQGHHATVVPHKNWLRSDRLLYFIRNVVRERQATRRMQKLIDEVRPDLVYVNTGASLAGAWAARRAKLPCVWHLRELFSDVQGELVTPIGGRPVARWVFHNLADRLVAPSLAVAANLLGAHAQEVEVIPNAAEESFFTCSMSQAEARQCFDLPSEGLILGVPGTLRPMKGHPFFFQSLPAVLQKLPGLTIAVTGEGQADYVEMLQGFVSDLKLTDRIHFLGVIKDMPAFLRAIDVACIPSVAEPFGRTVIEAFAVGTPVVATSVGGIRETVDDGKTGLLVSYGNVDALAEALLRLLQTPTLRNSIANRATDTAAQWYHERVYKKKTVTLIQKIFTNAED